VQERLLKIREVEINIYNLVMDRLILKMEAPRFTETLVTIYPFGPGTGHSNSSTSFM